MLACAKEGRLILFGGWANKWLDDSWQINVSSIVGPPYAINAIHPPLGPVTGGQCVKVHTWKRASDTARTLQSTFSFGVDFDAGSVSLQLASPLADVSGLGFDSTPGAVTVRFSTAGGKYMVDVQGTAVSDKLVECVTPNVLNSIGDSRHLVNTLCQRSHPVIYFKYSPTENYYASNSSLKLLRITLAPCQHVGLIAKYSILTNEVTSA
eukprot:1242975-Amphidinium_carterae.1